MASQAGFTISKIKRIGDRIFQKKLEKADISAFNGAQGKLLYILWQRDGISAAELAGQAGLAVTTLTSMLDRMERSGLILREPDPSDRRKTRIVLTERVKGLKEQYERLSDDMTEVYLRGFSPEETALFEEYLGRCLKNLEEEESYE